MYEAIVVGGGPAGLSAALPLARSHRRVLLIDAGEGRNAPAEGVHNVLGHDGTAPEALRRAGREQLLAYPTAEVAEGEVERAEPAPDGGFRLRTADGRTLATRRLVLATGLYDELPAVPGLAEIWGRTAVHCPYCHGYELTGERLAVLGSGPEKVRLALQLTRFTDDVVLLADGERPAREAAELLAAHGVTVRCERVLRFESADGRLEQIALEGAEPLPRDAVFVASTLRQRSPLAGQLGCTPLPTGAVEVDDFQRTSVPGVYAAGDMAHRAALPMPFAAVSVAAASGIVAGSMLDRELVGADFKLDG
ncbi:NAD(P)/FAD-dependent oxidoreductase [Streptomyces sp. NPDC051940]|uniref:NAD(P)/FAD-dependent oxidoreductase n=1 Tax=Streptomyces sp. NPDC051940 TaxID=3155675 RepID=UPI00344A8CD9